jgi:hypothetical protein
MNVDDVFKQAQQLSPDEQEELIQRLSTARDARIVQSDTDNSEHWGRSLIKKLDEIGPIEMKYPEIDDPVEWVQRLRADMPKRRLDDPM